MKRGPMFSGFSIGSIDWFWPELTDAPDQAARADRIEHNGFEDARLTHAMGGNLLRVFFHLGHVLQPLSAAKLDLSGLGVSYTRPWYTRTEEEKLAACDELAAFLPALRASVLRLPANGDGLNLWDLDAYLRGVRRYWITSGEALPPVRVLLTHVSLPPVPILEAPRDGILAATGRRYRFADLWNSYCEIQFRCARMVTHRYVVAPGGTRVVAAIEINNEPDYEWLPDELRIEKSGRPEAHAVRKYITELHNPQIPDAADPAPAGEPTPWGGFREQQGPWVETAPRPTKGVLDFDWGAKFDWYVARYAEWAEHFSYAVFHEARSHGASTAVISAGVTHNNIDYLIRMYRANPRCFEYCTGIGLHPYHWPGHDIYDTRFRRGHDGVAWRQAGPRTFAHDHFKCFDFFTEVHRLTQARGEASFGMEGKEIWLTEFGIPSKLLGTYNEHAAAFVPFIRPRPLPPEALPRQSAVWEDLWDAFFDQVQPAFLAAHNVKALVFYTLRESQVPGFDKHDDDRSNFAILRRNGLPRMESATVGRFTRFMAEATGVPRAPDAVRFEPMPAWSRRKDYSLRLLRSEPWRAAVTPAEVNAVVSMLQPDEKQFLYWLTSEYFSGAGAIIDAGCFAGGSTVALAAGLAAARGRETWGEKARINSYDMFVTDDFMRVHYFEANGLTTEGARFRNIYDMNTARWRDMLKVRDGDITTYPWTGGPIEILFIDVCKVWHVNDFVTREFFPKLIPGRSLVVQQDFFHHMEFWVIITQELLHDYFEYVGFVRWNTAVFRNVRPVPPEAIPPDLRALGLAELDRLMRRHIARHTESYQVGMLTCALACLHLDFDSLDEARRLHSIVSARYAGEHWVDEAAKDVANLLRAAEQAGRTDTAGWTPSAQLIEETASGAAAAPPARVLGDLTPLFAPALLAPAEWRLTDLDAIRAAFLDNPVGRLWAEIPGGHKWLSYFRTYEEVFARFRGRSPRVLEIGVDRGGSLRLWSAYFGGGTRIVGLDIVEACRRFERPGEGIFVRIGSQSDPDVLRAVAEEFGPFDLIIDDGSHRASDQIASFNGLFGHALKPGGIYFVEDLQCAYWGHRSGELDTPYTFVDFVRTAVDLMHKPYVDHDYPFFRIDGTREHPLVMPYITRMLEQVRFFDAAVALYKGERLPPLVEYRPLPDEPATAG
ncbi:MAG TPA: class I SAM-dependent methyltransferase [Acetobacteraceae bacterium]|nr:class I SAM-dependent methyltransferase [Acetobacteraceae bacterium]